MPYRYFTARLCIWRTHTCAFYTSALADSPKGARGLSVPAMPLGSPDMEMGERFMAYNILQLNENGETTIYAIVNSSEEQY